VPSLLRQVTGAGVPVEHRGLGLIGAENTATRGFARRGSCLLRLRSMIDRSDLEFDRLGVDIL
ncbi:uncharacterized protein METZ01_LOCUS89948, partial [marine metagenome]